MAGRPFIRAIAFALLSVIPAPGSLDGAEDSRAAPARFDRSGFTERFLQLLGAQPPGADRSPSAELVALVKTHTWHAVPLAVEWLVYLDPGSMKQLEKALSFQERALAIEEKIGNSKDIALTLANLGNIHTTRGQHGKALAFYERAIASSEKTSNDAETAFSLGLAAMSLDELGRLPEARSRLSRALDLLARSRALLAADRERISFLEKWQTKLLPFLRIALGPKTGSAADPALALRVLESLRGIGTADLFAASLEGVRGSSDESLAAEERAARREIDGLETKLQALLARGAGGKRSLREEEELRVSREKIRAEQRRLEDRWQDLFSRMARENPEYAALRRPDPMVLEDLEKALPADTAYLAFALGKEGSLLIGVDATRLWHEELEPGDTIRGAVKAHLELVHRKPGPDDASAILESGRRLYGLLLGPAEKKLEGKQRLLISPDDVLYGLPFETLIHGGEAAPGVTLATAPFLVRSHAFTYVHSATAWSLHRRRVTGRTKAGGGAATSGILVLADPVAPEEVKGGGEQTVVEIAFADLRGADLGRLPHSRREAFSILEIFGAPAGLDGRAEGKAWSLEVRGKRTEAAKRLAELKRARSTEPAVRDARITGTGVEVRLGRLASREALLRPEAHIEDLRFLHLAAHGLAHPENPGLSGVLLSPDEDSSGFLRLMDVMNVKLRAQLVTLSACETQLGKPTSGEGYQGLVRAFLYAGAESVIASSWRVPDAASARLLPAVYRHMLAGGLNAGAALRRAQLDYLESIPAKEPRLGSPYYWGAWTTWGSALEGKH